MNLDDDFSVQQTILDLKITILPIIIFGSGIVGEVLFKACENTGIKVTGFCDNNINKTKDSKCGIPVFFTPELKSKYSDAVVLISAADIRDAITQLQSLKFYKWAPCTFLLRDFNTYQHQFSAPGDFVQYATDTCILCHDSYSLPDKLFLRSVDIVITERCSLKCRDCSNLMSYYQKPMNCDSQELIKTIDAFCNIVDEVNEFRVLGGEPFMNPEFDIIIDRLMSEPKVKKIIVYTNGTIVPSDGKIQCLKSKKTLLIITDYGPALSKNLGILTEKLLSEGISYFVQKAGGWTDCNKIARNYRNSFQQMEIFDNCCAKNTITISEGKLHRCPFAANAMRLRAVPDFNDDYVEFMQTRDDHSEIKKKIRSFLFDKKFLAVCDYCRGRSFGDEEIPSAIQADKSLDYERYQY